ncbi:MAG: hypothetical protein FJZ01_21395 [Candidatus Sericytochromatia bacterium]|nr:hypothetical protein [Candidatus Tanganyikabacteria bacterium]
MPHAEEILALLDAQRCSECGAPAVRGTTMCLACAARVELPAKRRRGAKKAPPAQSTAGLGQARVV